MAKNVALIPGEGSNWEIAFFLLIDEMVPFLRPNMTFDRQDILSEAGINFLISLLGSIGYQLDKALEYSLQGTINRMIKKKGYIQSEYGRYTLTLKGYKRLKEIRKKYIPENKKYIGKVKSAMEILESLPKEKKNEVMRNYLKQ